MVCNSETTLCAYYEQIRKYTVDNESEVSHCPRKKLQIRKAGNARMNFVMLD